MASDRGEIRYCGSCGTLLPDGAAFCSVCGTRRGERRPVGRPASPRRQPIRRRHVELGLLGAAALLGAGVVTVALDDRLPATGLDPAPPAAPAPTVSAPVVEPAPSAVDPGKRPSATTLTSTPSDPGVPAPAAEEDPGCDLADPGDASGPVIECVFAASASDGSVSGTVDYCDRSPGAVQHFEYVFRLVARDGQPVDQRVSDADQRDACVSIPFRFGGPYPAGGYRVAAEVRNTTIGAQDGARSLDVIITP